jgi:hypothetical protein
MQENKTKQTSDSVAEFLDTILDDNRREDSKELVRFMASITGVQAAMWGPSIIGFGTYHYVYDSGREGDTVAVGFSPRKNAIVLYGIINDDQSGETSKKLGPVKLGKGCIYIKSLSEIDKALLGEMISVAFKQRNNAV